MAKEKFNWKSLFITTEENSEENKPEKTPAKSLSPSTSFPEARKPVSKFPDTLPKKILVNDAILTTIIEMYESGFESLNQPGYDFYEFFKAIKAVGSNDPSVYKMALTMAQSVAPEITKSTLLTQADFYIEEIEKVHKQYENQGNTKKTKILQTQKNQKETLNSEISTLEKNLIEIQNQISNKKSQLQSIDDNMITDLSEIDQKIIANDTARSKILETIGTVIDGIKNNI